MTIELVSFEDIQAVIDLGELDADSYPALPVLMESVVFAIESYLSRTLTSAVYTESTRVMQKTTMVSLSALPITAVSSVSVTQQGSTESLTIDDDYLITDYGLMLLSSVSNSVVEVVYTGGYLSSNIPGALNRAALLQTIYEFQGKDTIGATSVSTEGGSVQTPALGLLKEVRRLLDPFKHQLAWS